MNVKKKSIMSDLKKIDEMTDAEIDYSEIPALDDAFFEKEAIFTSFNSCSVFNAEAS